METTSQVARFIAARIEASGRLQQDLAARAGFDKPNVIARLKQGKTRLPLDKVGPLAQALPTDPVELFALCMQEYHPETWAAIAPFMETAFTSDERALIRNLRAYAGGPYLSVLGEETQSLFQELMQSLRCNTRIQ